MVCRVKYHSDYFFLKNVGKRNMSFFFPLVISPLCFGNPKEKINFLTKLFSVVLPWNPEQITTCEQN